ncbi:MAG: cation-transporting P-type ATPase [Oscillospiraceae bacterium]|nr:cation-transporting P-type ATPase [Oscillospiraceae bacterium]
MAFYGLSRREAEAARQKYGPNVRSYNHSFLQELGAGFSALSVRLIIISALTEAITLVLGLLGAVPEYTSIMKLVGVAAAVVLFAFAEAALRYSASRELKEASRCMAMGVYPVFRGVEGTADIPAEEITVGDSVYLTEGDVVPADGILEDGNVTVEQSVFGINGRSEKTTAPVGYRDNGLLSLDNPYCLYRGTVICSGSGVLKITAIGDSTQIAKRQEDVDVIIPEQSFKSLVKTGNTAGILTAVAALAVCTLVGAMAGGLLRGFLAGVSACALTLAAAAFGRDSLACRLCAVRTVHKLEASGISPVKPERFENAAAASLLFTDKTGMITRGEYTVSGFIDGGGKEYSSFEKVGGSLGKLLKATVTSIAGAELISEGVVRGGSPADKAMVGFVKGMPKNASMVKRQAEFREGCLYGVTVTLGNGLATIIKGSAEDVLERCSEYQPSEGKRQRITNKSALQKLTSTLSVSGKDVEGIAFTNEVIKDGELPEKGFVLVGFMALQDSYCQEAAEQVKRLKGMGIRTVLVTACDRENAVFTAKLAGIKKKGGVILDSDQLREMTEADLDLRFGDIKAVAGATEKDKLRLIKAAHRAGAKVCTVLTAMKETPVLTEADVSFASSSAGSAIRSVCDASASDECGVKCAADYIELSRRFSRDYKIWLTARVILAIAVAAAAIGMGW